MNNTENNSIFYMHGGIDNYEKIRNDNKKNVRTCKECGFVFLCHDYDMSSNCLMCEIFPMKESKK